MLFSKRSLHGQKMQYTFLFAYSAQMYFSTESNEIFVLLLVFFFFHPMVQNCQMNNKIIPLFFLCSRYDVRSPFRIQTLSSRPWLPKYPILACSSFDTSANAYLLQLSYTLFESSQYSKFDNQIKQLSL